MQTLTVYPEYHSRSPGRLPCEVIIMPVMWMACLDWTHTP